MMIQVRVLNQQVHHLVHPRTAMNERRSKHLRTQQKETPLTIANSRLLSQLARRVAEHDAVLQLYMFLPLGHPVLTAMTEKAREWYNEKRSDKAPPYIYKIKGLMSTVIQMPTVPEDLKHPLRQLLALSDEELEYKILVCKTSKAWDKSKLRLVLEVELDIKPLFRQVLNALKSTGTMNVVGVAPRSGLEREIADELVDIGVFASKNM
eukprot:TRINITY_DN103176_c0_g1_i1.p1 TRINITY_DN103176_c0_g1~~TRINITY_DN103176_c0_g1_i1.p1  ORF type:complete len:208 (-),score=29.15 TRINITY_DN103176_c0_g1_i1:459-1082(-)